MQNTAAIPGRRESNRTRQRASSTLVHYLEWDGRAPRTSPSPSSIVIAGFGAWRAYDSGTGGGEIKIPVASEGRYAQAPMTPVPIASAGASSAVAPITACDVSGNILILKDLAKGPSPAPGTSIYTVRYDSGLEDSGSDLMIGCESEESTLLASNVLDVTRGPWPGTLMVATTA